MNNTKTGIKDGWNKVALFSVAYIICSLVAGLLLNSFTDLSPTGFTYLLIFITGIISIVLIHLFGYRFGRQTLQKNTRDIKFKLRPGMNTWWRDSLIGLLLSAGLIGTGACLLNIAGLLHWSINDVGTKEFILPAVLMLWIAFYEELVFRGFILENLMVSFKQPVALLISAGIFALFHAFNPGTSILAIINILCGGLLIGLTYMHNRNLWFPVFFHFGWNYIQGPVLGFSVSGIQLPSMLNAHLSGKEWLTGGHFGFEGSALQVPVVLIGIIILLSSPKQN